MPYFHDMGLIGTHLAPLAARARQVKIGPMSFAKRPRLWFEVTARHRGTVLSAANFALALAVRRVPDEVLARLDLSAVRVLLVGAEPIAPTVWRAFAAKTRPAGLDPAAARPVYGLAEATLAVTFPPPGEVAAPLVLDRAALSGGVVVDAEPGDGAVELMDVGRPVAGCSVRVVDDAGGRPRGPAGRAHHGERPPTGPWLPRTSRGERGGVRRGLAAHRRSRVPAGRAAVRHGLTRTCCSSTAAPSTPRTWRRSRRRRPGCRPGPRRWSVRPTPSVVRSASWCSFPGRGPRTARRRCWNAWRPACVRRCSMTTYGCWLCRPRPFPGRRAENCSGDGCGSVSRRASSRRTSGVHAGARRARAKPRASSVRGAAKAASPVRRAERAVHRWRCAAGRKAAGPRT